MPAPDFIVEPEPGTEAAPAVAEHASGDEVDVGTPDGSVLGVPYRWVAMGVVLFGTFMVVLDTTVVNLGLPALQQDFDTVTGVELVVSAYLAAVGVSQMVSGWLADKYGRKSVFIAALGLFTVSSLLCAMAPSLEFLIGGRILQGVGGGTMMPVAMAMIYELFAPDERGKALGYFGIAVMAAPAIGPVLGGSLLSHGSWRVLFLINLPVGVIGFFVAIFLLRDTGIRQDRRLDRVGLLLSGGGITAALVGIERGASQGWVTVSTVGLLSAGALLLALFVRHALVNDNPLVEIRILANPVFAIGMVTVALTTMAQYTRLVYIPIELGSVRQIEAFQVGLTMLPSALGMALTMPLGGRLTDRIGARIPVTVGVSVFGATFFALSQLTLDTPLPIVGGILFVGGLGAGLSMMAPNLVAMNSVQATQVSQGSGLSQVSRQLSAAAGTAVMASIFATMAPSPETMAADPSKALDPFSTLFMIGAVVAGLAVLVAQWLPGKAKALELQADRAAEMEALGLDAGAVARPALIE